MLRRDALKYLTSLAALPALPAALVGAIPAAASEASSGPHFTNSASFSIDTLIARARDMADVPYVARAEVPEAWKALSYDQYKSIWFRNDRALWNGTDTPYRVDFFHPGLYFPRPVQINIVENGVAQRVGFDFALFDKTDQVPDLPIDENMGYSGLRLRTELEKPGIHQEFMVMQGASYFRAISKGQIYGLSARGLAIDTAEGNGEEFPDFTEFWIERPNAGQQDIRLHALLDSPSTVGVYTFDIMPGAPTVIDVTAVILPRTDMTHVGIAPLTSMFLFDETNRGKFDDFRPAVHDNDGLLIQNGAGETLWRALSNPAKLQVSSFVDMNPKGFGLMQRANRFSDFADLEALYHKRPGLWIEPGEDWGKGVVTLVEIPADREIYDNIVAYWRPMDGLAKGSEHSFTYRMTWGDGATDPLPVAKVLNTRMGSRFSGGYIVAIDFEADAALPDDLTEITMHISGNRGSHSDGILQRNPETGGPRLAFSFDPEGASAVELRAQLRHKGRMVSEVWLYRWTAS
jgi:glucans biosynthesis protein